MPVGLVQALQARGGVPLTLTFEHVGLIAVPVGTRARRQLHGFGGTPLIP